MNYVKTIVCFANSRKTAGRCIAGKEWQDGAPGEWVRPVSTRPTHEISKKNAATKMGVIRSCSISSVFRVMLISRCPIRARTMLSTQAITGQNRDSCLGRTFMTGWIPPIIRGAWGQGSYAGLNNRVAIGQEDGTSLYLVSVERLRLLVGRKAPEYPDSKRAVRGEFVYRGRPTGWTSRTL